MHVHTVLVTLRDPATDLERIAARMASMRNGFTGLLGLDVVRDEDGGDHACHLALVTRWTDRSAYEAYRHHPDHQAVAADVRAAMLGAVTLDHTA